MKTSVMLSLVTFLMKGPLVQNCEAESRKPDQQDQHEQHHESKGQCAQEHVLQLDPVIVERGLDDEAAQSERRGQQSDLGCHDGDNAETRRG